MTTSHSQTITIVAIVFFVLAVPLVWGIADVRDTQAVEREKADLVDGTVATRQAPADYDGDGVRDAADRCPTRPEVSNGYQDGDGCPDVVATTGAS
ncbi:thrombospondin type 3 repeat-containing protein [Natrinema caseinilyticum]|uniref:thrombospondin type 3 repeat-containing protein n=1 Tax=Natrinema caseinilyticum TaxID=2961570 RepID=UPI0020C2C3A5|nr:thrombospondin type 3 repeat-containing protein [Natrinema caseinilyticum]